MSQQDLLADRTATYDAILRLIKANRGNTQACRKLTERMEWLNTELDRLGYFAGLD